MSFQLLTHTCFFTEAQPKCFYICVSFLKYPLNILFLYNLPNSLLESLRHFREFFSDFEFKDNYILGRIVRIEYDIRSALSFLTIRRCRIPGYPA